MSKEQFDILISKWISRKLLVFAVASIGMFLGYITSEDWVTIGAAYVGLESFITVVEKLKK
jgi:hypothetical protein